MSFSSENGYTPMSIETMMGYVMDGVNDQFGTTYTTETFLGTNWYKFFYALIQKLQENEIKTSEIFVKLQDYFALTNERISRPVVTAPGIVEKLEAEGYTASVKPPLEADAGKLFVCVDTVDKHARGLITITSYANLVSGTDDVVTVGATGFTAQVGAATPGTATFQAATSNTATAASLAAQINAHATAGALVEATSYGAIVLIRAKTVGTGGNSIVLGYTDNDTNVGATKSATTLLGGAALDTDEDDYDDVRLDIATILKDSVAGGIMSLGLEIETITLSNGQSFDFGFCLPNRITTMLRLTTTLSENNQLVVGNPDDVKQALLDNIAASYKLGKNFEPQRYFTIVDAPWCESVLLEYSIDGGSNWLTAVYDSDFDALLEFSLANTELVEA